MAARFHPVSLGSPRFHTMEQGGLLVTDAWFPPSLVLAPHLHDRTVLAMTVSGGWDSVMGGRPHVSSTGMVLTEPVGERHGNHFGTVGAHVVIIQPDPARLDAMVTTSRFLERIAHFAAPAALALGRRLSTELRFPDSASPLAIEGLSLEVLAVASRRAEDRREPDHGPIWLRRVLAQVHESFLTRLTMRDLTLTASVHPAHLAREFRRHYRVSVGEYVRRLRLDWAADRLLRTSSSITDIASAAGFADQSHFTRAFRRQTGLPPRRFRQAHR